MTKILYSKLMARMLARQALKKPYVASALARAFKIDTRNAKLDAMVAEEILKIRNIKHVP